MAGLFCRPLCYRWKITGGILILFWLALAMPGLAQDPPAQTAPPVTGRPQGGDFVLHALDAEVDTRKLRGKVVLLYFGYSKCPDVCPTNLALITQALNKLSDKDLNKVLALFISVDPERDTLEQLDRYAGYFHPNILGVTGSEAEIKAAARLYGAQYYRQELPNSALGYAMNHSAASYIVDQSGKLRFIFPHATDSSMLLKAILYLLAEKRG